MTDICKEVNGANSIMVATFMAFTGVPLMTEIFLETTS